MPAHDDTELLAAIARTQDRIRDLEAVIGLLAVRHGQHVGLGTYHLRICQEEAFALRSHLPQRQLAVTMTQEPGGDFLITVL